MVNSRPPRRPLPRILLLRIIIVLAFLTLAGQLWRLQIVQGDTYRWKANNNRFRVVSLQAPRGVIYDRRGYILARNRPRHQVAVMPEDLPQEEAEQERVLRRLLRLLQTPLSSEEVTARPDEASSASAAASTSPARTPLSLEEMKAKIAEACRGGSFRPVLVNDNVPRDTALVIEEESINLPGVQVLVQPRREYPSGALTSHVIGYTGPIPRESVDVYTERGYAPTDQVGLAGLELTFEDDLRGQAGHKLIMVDVHGREVRTVGQPQAPIPGHNLILTLDLELQQVVEDALRRGVQAANSRSGVAIIMDPRDGAVLAMVSLPTYDNNLFAEGISVEEYAALSEDPDRPLVNHAISGIYPPGSTFKIIPAAAGLEEGVITPRTLLGDGEDGANDGVIWLPNKYFPDDRRQDQPFYCWSHKHGFGHGRINLVQAIAVSCDIFFYQLAGGYYEFEGLGVETLDEYARLFGLGEVTGIDLPGEHRGLVPDPKWKRLTYAENWVTGDTYNMAIGQGFILATPLQMLNATAAVANDGYLYRPQLVYQITDADGNVLRAFTPELIRELPIAKEHLALVREGMYQAVNWEHGTATKAALPDIAVAGKTGTAEFFIDRNRDGWPDRDAKGNLPTHAWFTAFAPYEDPEIALVVFIEGGGEGSSAAVPVAAEILRAYFDLQKARESEPTEAEAVPQPAVEELAVTPPDEARHGQ